jgi:hypothetical protein
VPNHIYPFLPCVIQATRGLNLPSGGITLLKIICWQNDGRVFTNKSKRTNEIIARRVSFDYLVQTNSFIKEKEQ